ncbi:MAG: guanylate kinase [Halobacteriovorax sp.]|nr:guanylate kinase [Halobacteriovorax sp.]|tara:strand:- start:148751 stop:149323 length:573 start_codon:yes stop_codon:yes gene_type:complete
MAQTEGKIIIIVAPSGSGKSTLIQKIKEEFKNLEWSVSFTTRPQREGEVDGVAYNFINKEEFEQRRDKNEFLEWALVHQNYYGTSKIFVEEKLKEGINILFDLDVQGVDSFKEYFGDKAKAIFIAPPSIEALKSRLLQRGTDNIDVINVRLENAQKELLRKDDFDYCVVNDEIDRAHQELRSVILEIMES